MPKRREASVSLGRLALMMAARLERLNMTELECLAAKRALTSELECRALALEIAPGLKWPAIGRRRMGYNHNLGRAINGPCGLDQARYADEKGLPGVQIKMGRTVWRLNSSPFALRHLAAELSKLRCDRFSAWEITELET